VEKCPWPNRKKENEEELDGKRKKNWIWKGMVNNGHMAKNGRWRRAKKGLGCGNGE
jgi:hypothetical protein